MPAAQTIREQLENFADFLVSNGHALSFNAFVHSSDEVTWYRRPNPDPFLPSRSHHSLENYLSWVRNGEFSVMLADGALLQFTYQFAGEAVRGHRLGYVPCPFADEDEILSDADVDFFVDYYSSAGLDAVQFQSAVRFDYDPDNAAPGHPASHLTINTSETRIACAGPVSPDRFVRFVFTHFYPQATDVIEYFDRLPKAGQFPSHLSEDDKADIHLSWPT